MEKIISRKKEVIDLVIKNSNRIILLIILSVLTILMSNAPYINLFFGNILVLYLLFVYTIMIFNINIKKIINLISIFWILTLLVVLFGDISKAEILANFSLGLFVVVVIKTMFHE